MFSQEVISPWLAIQRASQVTMILLAFAMLILPVLHQTQEASAEPISGLAICIITGCFVVVAAIAAVCVGHAIRSCQGPCGRWGVGEGHERMCNAGHTYYYCYPNAGWLHATCS